MALQRPLWALQYSGVLGIMSPLKIVQGGTSSPYPTNTNILNTNSGLARTGCVHKGKPYILTSSGWITFNSAISKWELTNRINITTGIQASIGSYFIYLFSNFQHRWESPEANGSDASGYNIVASNITDWVVHNNTIYGTAPGTTNIVWSYPFNQPLAWLGATATLVRLAVHRGAVYGLYINTAANSRLYKWEGGRWNVQGAAGFDITDKATTSATASDRWSFFSWNGKLWMIAAYSGAATWCYRCWEVGLDGDTITENTSVIPAALQVPPGGGVTRYIWDLCDDAGNSRQVFIGFHARASATLDVYEFDSEIAAMSLVANTGASVYIPPILWDPTCHSCEIKSAQDSYPSEYATITHQVSDINTNGNVDIDIRYKDCADSTTDPPWAACTNKTGHGEGKTGLSTKPSGITLATDLSDGFSGPEVNWNKWGWSNQAISWTIGDYGSVSGLSYQKQNIVIQNGQLRLGGTTPAPTVVVTGGIGLRSKWLIGSDFSVDVDIETTNLTNSAGTPYNYSLVFLAREAYDQIYGINIWIETGPIIKCGGFTCSPGAVPSLLAVPVVVLNGDTFRISRAAGVWSLTHDPAGAANNLLPAVTPAYTNEVQFYLMLMNIPAVNPVSGTPGPGFDNFTVNSGTLGRYLDVVEHTFAWDHATDVGAVVNKAFQLYSDTD